VQSGWSVALHGDAAIVVAPEGDLRAVLIETSAANAEDAVKSAWAVLHPDFSRTVELVVPRPGRHGWDEMRTVSYETSPNEKLSIYARVLRKGSKWVAVAVEGSDATTDKRAAQLRRTFDTLSPAGWVRESFAGKKAHALDEARIKTILDAADAARIGAGIPGEGIALVQNGEVVFE